MLIVWLTVTLNTDYRSLLFGSIHSYRAGAGKDRNQDGQVMDIFTFMYDYLYCNIMSDGPSSYNFINDKLSNKV